jgi:hypothetical protein
MTSLIEAGHRTHLHEFEKDLLETGSYRGALLYFGFAGIVHVLFVFCRLMLWMALIEDMAHEGKSIRFHLVTPAYEPIVIPS